MFYLGIFFDFFIQDSGLETVFDLFWLLGTRTILKSQITELSCAAPVSCLSDRGCLFVFRL